jgi:hypothetical protein
MDVANNEAASMVQFDDVGASLRMVLKVRSTTGATVQKPIPRKIV